MSAQNRPTAGFFLDLLIAIVTLVLLSMVCGVAWGAVVGVQVALEKGAPFSPDDLMQALSDPAPILLILMTLVSTGGAALLLYFWRQRYYSSCCGMSMPHICREMFMFSFCG